MSICLSMIVKNESAVIRRCLRSVKPVIDSYSISDTGSTDDTLEIIREEMTGIPGVLTNDAWVDFSTNRNIAQSRATGDWILIVDADETVELSGEPIVFEPGCEGFLLRVYHEGGHHWSIRLLRNDPRWQWKFKVHEIPTYDGSVKLGKMKGLSLHSFFDSHQNVTGSKYSMLLEFFESEPATPRNVLNHANALNAIGRYEEAIAKYEEFARMSEEGQEVYSALWLRAICSAKANMPFDEVATAFFRAYIFRPERYEALVTLCELLRSRNLYLESYNLSKIEPVQTRDLARADDSAMWRILEEYAIAAYYLGKKDESRIYFERILSHDLPAEDRERTLNNLRFVK